MIGSIVSRATTPAVLSASALSSLAGSWSYVGCYVDAVADRMLSGATNIQPNTMTEEFCLNYCHGLGFKYAGVEYHQECCTFKIFAPLCRLRTLMLSVVCIRRLRRYYCHWRSGGDGWTMRDVLHRQHCRIVRRLESDQHLRKHGSDHPDHSPDRRRVELARLLYVRPRLSNLLCAVCSFF